LEISGPGGWQEEHGFAAIPALDRAEAAVRLALSGLPGVVIERKRLALAVHHRQVDPNLLPEVERAVAGAIADEPDLRRGQGKRVFEIRPDIGWNKGTAAWRILEVHDRPPGRDLPIYIGDDLTDEDAFAFAVKHDGLAIVVGSPSWATSASYRLADPDEVVRFLRALVAHAA
jgi:alpha,alpha-trehalase